MNIPCEARHRGPRRALAALVAACLAGTVSQSAWALTAPTVAAMAARVLAYDHGLEARADGQVDVLVLGHPGGETDEAAAFANLSGSRIKNLPVDVTMATPTQPELRVLMAAVRPDAVFVDGRDDLMAELVVQARARGFLIIVTDRKLLDVGAHLAIVEVGGKPRMMVSLAATRVAGIRLSADLLKIAILAR